MRRRFALAAILLLCSSFQVLAVDCAKPSGSIEERICSDPPLRQLNALLDREYMAFVERQGLARARQMQGEWLRLERDICLDNTCLEAAYTKRIMELTQAERVFVFREASPDWDLVITASICGREPDESSCTGPGTVNIFAKDSGSVQQRIVMPELFVELHGTGQPTVNKAQIYGEYNSCLVLADYNFDGRVDLALRNGNNGAYWGPSYDIYLFDPGKKRFIRNDALTEVSGETLGLFAVDAENKQLVTLTKNGCCWHQTAFYEVRKNAPVLVREVTEDGTLEKDTMVITDRKLVSGEWQVTEDREPLENYQ